MEIKELITTWLKSSPKWVKIILPFLAAAIAAMYLCTSCGTIQNVQLDKRTTREVKDTSRLIISQTTSRTLTRSHNYALGRALVVGEVLPETSRQNANASCVLTPTLVHYADKPTTSVKTFVHSYRSGILPSYQCPPL